MRALPIIAGVVAVGLAVIVFMKVGDQAPAPAPSMAPVAAAPEVKTSSIYVASQPIPVGTVITQEMIAVQPWPENLKLETFIGAEQGAKDIVGQVARSAFQAQEPIIKSKLASPADANFLAGELPKGMRVVTIMTNETEGVAGFLFPGDHVDVMLTHDINQVPVTETVLTNVKVLAVDQRATGASAMDKEGHLLVPHSVSLMLSQQDAQRVRLAQRMGTVTLALRSLQDRDSADPLTVTGVGDVSQRRGNNAPAAAPASPAGAVRGGAALSADSVMIYRGAPKESTTDTAPVAGSAPAGAAGVAPMGAPQQNQQQNMGQQ